LQVQVPVALTVPLPLQVTAFEYWHCAPAYPAAQVPHDEVLGEALVQVNPEAQLERAGQALHAVEPATE
jgi:hypothetical protein